MSSDLQDKTDASMEPARGDNRAEDRPCHHHGEMNQPIALAQLLGIAVAGPTAMPSPGHIPQMLLFALGSLPMSFEDIPAWLLTNDAALARLLLLAMVLVAIAAKHRVALDLFSAVFRFVTGGEKERSRRRTRQLLARTLRAELERINKLNDWAESRFAQLEAEVEVESRRAWWWRILRPWTPATTLRREPSLSRALRTSREQLIILEGDPGAGKSVALRRVASEVMRRALRPFRMLPVLPVYLNLRDLRRPEGAEIDAALIASFVRRSLNRTRSQSIGEYLDAQLVDEIAQGRLLFLFDSFDEIPEILASTSADEVVGAYAHAIRDFCVTMSGCRAVIASREYRGPQSLPATRFRILRMSLDRQQILVRNFGLPVDAAREIEAYLGDPDLDMRLLLDNPMFLSLACKRLACEGRLARSPREVFSSYVETRSSEFRADIARHLGGRAPGVLHAFARAVAFEMALDAELGLNPSRARLIRVLAVRGHLTACKIEPEDAYRFLDALEVAKIGRPGDDPEERSFTFVHRRFQEFFAAEILLTDPDRIPPATLIADARWREAAVALLQTQNATSVVEILAATEACLEAEASAIRATTRLSDLRLPHPWQPTTLHLLGILNAAYAGRADALPRRLSDIIVFIAREVRARGTILDLKWVLEVAGVVPSEEMEALFPHDDELDFDVLRDAALRTLSKLPKLTSDVRMWLYRTLVGLVATGAMRQRKWTIHSQLLKLKDPGPFFAAIRLASALRWAQATTFAVYAAVFLWVTASAGVKAHVYATAKLSILDQQLSASVECLKPCIQAWGDDKAMLEGIDRACVDRLACAPSGPEVPSHSAGQCGRPPGLSQEIVWCGYTRWTESFDVVRRRDKVRMDRLSTDLTFVSLCCFWAALGTLGVWLRGATADVVRSGKRWLNRAAWCVLIGAGTMKSSWATVLVTPSLCVALWVEGGSLLATRGELTAIWFWPAYSLIGLIKPLLVLALRAEGPRSVLTDAPRAPGLSERAAVYLGSCFAVVFLSLPVVVGSRSATVGALWGTWFVLTWAACVAWLWTHAAGYAFDFYAISRVLHRETTGTMPLDRFLSHLMALRGASSANAFVEAVERHQLLLLDQNSWRILAALPGVILEDRERFARQMNLGKGDVSWLERTVAKMLVPLVLDESFGAPANVMARVFFRLLRRKRDWGRRLTSSALELLPEDTLLRDCLSREPWALASRGKRIAIALISLADQMHYSPSVPRRSPKHVVLVSTSVSDPTGVEGDLDMGASVKSPADVVILCALRDPELDKVKRASGLPWTELQPTLEDPQTYYNATYTTATGAPLRVVAAVPNHMGMPASAVLATKMIIRFRPKLVVMVGIAAGVKEEDLEFGDILAAEHTFDYGSGKITLAGDKGQEKVMFQPDPKPLDVDARLLQRLRHWQSDKGDVLDAIRRAWVQPQNKVLKMHVGPLASGAAVVDSKQTVDQIVEHWRKLVGLEMEAYAVHRACKDTIEPQPKFLCLKSICDFAQDKEDGWQSYAAFTAGELCYRFLVAEWESLFPDASR